MSSFNKCFTRPESSIQSLENKVYVGASSVKVISCRAISRCVPALSAAPGIQLAQKARYGATLSVECTKVPTPPPALHLLYITVCKRGSLLPAVHFSDFKLTQHVQLPPPAVLLLPSRHGFAQPNLSNPVTPTHVRYTRCHATLPVQHRLALLMQTFYVSLSKCPKGWGSFSFQKIVLQIYAYLRKSCILVS